ncbi:MAG TPA: hypothetical protein VNA28_00195 [Solirubrobacteraceae bacterium]|nr:hypothetical protein [Solirubrobacteraceae bacterium]
MRPEHVLLSLVVVAVAAASPPDAPAASTTRLNADGVHRGTARFDVKPLRTVRVAKLMVRGPRGSSRVGIAALRRTLRSGSLCLRLPVRSAKSRSARLAARVPCARVRRSRQGTHRRRAEVRDARRTHLIATWADASQGQPPAPDLPPPDLPPPDPPPPVSPAKVGAIELPVAPQPYPVPAGALVVSTPAALAAALSATTERDIVLADGNYSPPSGYFRALAAHRLYAANLGRAVLQGGLMIGGPGTGRGAEVHGLVFDVADRAKTFEGSALYIWGDGGRGTQVLDTVIHGHGVLDVGINMRAVQDIVVQRIVVRNMRRAGVLVSDCCAAGPFAGQGQAATITDLDVEGVREVVPGSPNGTAEAGVWIGNPVRDPVARLHVRGAYWMGLWTGAGSRETVFRDLTIDAVGRSSSPAVYSEHRTIRNTFERFRLGPDITAGFICEWNYGSGPGACDGNIYQDGTVDSRGAGVFFDQGSLNNVVRRVRFLNQTCAAIVDNGGTTNTSSDNDVAGLGPGGAPSASTC